MQQQACSGTNVVTRKPPCSSRPVGMGTCYRKIKRIRVLRTSSVYVDSVADNLLMCILSLLAASVLEVM